MNKDYRQNKKNLNHAWFWRLLSWPSLTWFIFFIFIPLLLVIALSFASKGTYGDIVWMFSFKNYEKLLNWDYLAILVRTLTLSVLISILSVVFALLSAWYIVTQALSQKKWFLFLIVVPFFSNLIMKVYSIKNLVSTDGLLANLALFIDPKFDVFILSSNIYLVIYGMFLTYLPFAFFPIYSAFEKFDFQLVDAAQDLGASASKSFFTVILPNIRVAIISGFLLVFIPSLGEFVIPDILGGAKTMYLGNLITDQFLKNRDWPLGAAQSIALIFFLLLTFSILIGIRRARSNET